MPEPVFETTFSLTGLSEAVRSFWEENSRFRIIAFSGELGAGKTTFIRHLCDFLGVKDPVSSPTFALVNEYHFFQNQQEKRIFHMDWYRLRDAEEAFQAGIEDALLEKDALCFVEWPEKAGEILPKPYLSVQIEALDETSRLLRAFVIRE